MKKKVMFLYTLVIFLGVLIVLWFFLRNPQNATEPSPRNIQILIEGKPGIISTQNTLLRITGGNILEVMTFSYFGLDNRFLSPTAIHFDITNISEFVDINGNNVIITYDTTDRIVQLPNAGEIVTHKGLHLMGHSSRRVLTARQLNNIWELAENVVMGGSGVAIRLSYPSRYVWAIIDGEMYQSYFASALPERNEEINQRLLYLVYYLIDLSPISP